MRKCFYIFLILTIINMAVIFFFSSQSGEQSQSISDGIVAGFVFEDTPFVTNENIEVVKDTTVLYVRKAAHFTLFLCLGIFVYMTIINSKLSCLWYKKMILAFLLCVLYAASDEFHQMFVDGRDSNITDVLIDSCGSVFGILSVWMCTRFIFNRK